MHGRDIGFRPQLLGDHLVSDSLNPYQESTELPATTTRCREGMHENHVPTS